MAIARIWNGTAWVDVSIAGAAGINDHGSLSGLTDDDHPQYLNTARGDARYYTRAQVDTLLAAAADKTHRHVQATAATVWSVAHNLNKRVSVTTVDSTMEEIIGDVKYIDLGHVTITFSAAVSGEAYVN